MIDLSIPGDELYSKFKYAINSKSEDKKEVELWDKPLKNYKKIWKDLLAGVEIVEKIIAMIAITIILT